MIFSRQIGIGTSRIEPRIELALVSEHRTQLLVLMAVNRKTLFLLPAIKRPNAAVEVTRNFFPRVQPVPELSRFDLRIRVGIHQDIVGHRHDVLRCHLRVADLASSLSVRECQRREFAMDVKRSTAAVVCVLLFVMAGPYPGAIGRETRNSDAGQAGSLDCDPVLSDACAKARLKEGRRLFDVEKFGGNGRTCRTCHSNRTGTFSPEDALARLIEDPSDALFV